MKKRRVFLFVSLFLLILALSISSILHIQDGTNTIHTAEKESTTNKPNENKSVDTKSVDEMETEREVQSGNDANEESESISEDSTETSKENKKTESPVMKYVSSFSLNLRSKPSPNSNVITILKVNDEVLVEEKLESGWVKISFGKYIGYVDERFLSDEIDRDKRAYQK